MFRYRAAVVASHGSITGIVGEDIAVLPDMSPKRQLEFMAARAAVAEVGGQLAHLAVVSRELGRTLMVLPGACTKLPPGTRVTLNPARCEILVEGPCA